MKFCHFSFLKNFGERVYCNFFLLYSFGLFSSFEKFFISIFHRWTEGVGGCLPQKRCLLKGVIKPEETWADKGRYPLIKSENRGDVVYGWSLRSLRRSRKSRKSRMSGMSRMSRMSRRSWRFRGLGGWGGSCP